MNLAKLLENTAERIPNHIGLRFEARDYSFSELNRLANRMANGLNAAGLKNGDKCVLMMQSIPQFVTTYYALAKIGAVIVPVNFLYKSHELSHIFRDSGAKGFIGMEPYLEEPRKVLIDLPDLGIRIAAGVGKTTDFIPLQKISGPDTYETYPAKDDETLAILYTSGTTGLPKGAMLTHKNLYSNAMTVADMRENEPDDVVIGILPLYHIFGQTSALNASIYRGMTFHLFPQFDPRAVIKLIENETTTILFAVPTILNRLVQETDHSGIVRRFVKERVAPYKYPRIIHLVDDLPKSHTGKVLKRKLRDRRR